MDTGWNKSVIPNLRCCRFLSIYHFEVVFDYKTIMFWTSVKWRAYIYQVHRWLTDTHFAHLQFNQMNWLIFHYLNRYLKHLVIYVESYWKLVLYIVIWEICIKIKDKYSCTMCAFPVNINLILWERFISTMVTGIYDSNISFMFGPYM